MASKTPKKKKLTSIILFYAFTYIFLSEKGSVGFTRLSKVVHVTENFKSPCTRGRTLAWFGGVSDHFFLRIFVPEIGEVSGGWRKSCNEEINDL